ncbi:hypothetical protein SJAG_02238 [Schizosaccharomyces japonicus yFS275]|uniref:Ell binding protein Ebp1 C-terminal domain-containing protein n=1 Tax=Schizosaccharomyces japonicus (strain yFS275 / FY16936) TaxID=402676 RepID=B6K1X5_SCHJY|nr:hypothetical protein SJAG_02238 [Schizosaccharomyces japonicus yFS275]EEB07156.1 hypothetical protein SJAG_02238 [Schizosaccharomyces japonicus yFS275]
MLETPKEQKTVESSLRFVLSSPVTPTIPSVFINDPVLPKPLSPTLPAVFDSTELDAPTSPTPNPQKQVQQELAHKEEQTTTPPAVTNSRVRTSGGTSQTTTSQKQEPTVKSKPAASAPVSKKGYTPSDTNKSSESSVTQRRPTLPAKTQAHLPAETASPTTKQPSARSQEDSSAKVHSPVNHAKPVKSEGNGTSDSSTKVLATSNPNPRQNRPRENPPTVSSSQESSAGDKQDAKRKLSVTLSDYRKLRKHETPGTESSRPTNSHSSENSTPVSSPSSNREAQLSSLFKKFTVIGKRQKKEADKKGTYSQTYAVDALLCYILAFEAHYFLNELRKAPPSASNWRTLPAYIHYIQHPKQNMHPHLRSLCNQIMGIVFQRIFTIEMRRMDILQHNVSKRLSAKKGLQSPEELEELKSLTQLAVKVREAWYQASNCFKLASTLLPMRELLSNYPKTWALYTNENSTPMPMFLDHMDVKNVLCFGRSLLQEWAENAHFDSFTTELKFDDIHCI